MKRLLPILCLTACTSLDPLPLLGSDPDRGGAPGEIGAFGVSRWETAVRARATTRVDLIFLLPTVDGEPPATPSPVVIFNPGGFVTPERYVWQGEHLASRGYITVIPTYPGGLAILNPGNSQVALETLYEQSNDSESPLFGWTDPSAPVAVAGHSLGGVIAAMHFNKDPDIDALILEASFPANSTKVEDSQAGRSVLGITGTTDGVSPGEFEEEWSRFSEPFVTAVVEGMNHYAWTDQVKESDQVGDKDGPLLRPVNAVRNDAWLAMDAFLDASLLGDEEAWTYALDNRPDTLTLEGAP